MLASFEAPRAGAAVSTGPLRLRGVLLDRAAPLEGALLVADDGTTGRVRLGLWRQELAYEHPEVLHAGAAGFDGTIDLRGRARTVRVALMAKPRGGPWEEAAAVELELTAHAVRPAAGRRHAAFTVVKDEPVMLPLWLRHYGRWFEADDLYVLDHDSTVPTAAGIEDSCSVVQVHREGAFDHDWLRSTVETFQRFLLQSYDAVLFAEADELVVADPVHYSGLDDYIDRMERAAARCSGFNVVHQPGEPALDFDAPLLAQRSVWHASLQYCKRLLSRVPSRWAQGFHDELGAPDDAPDPHLLLVHLHRIDYDACRERHRRSAARDWDPAEVERGFGGQNRIAEPAEFERWFRHGEDLDAPPELIPEHIREAL